MIRISTHPDDQSSFEHLLSLSSTDLKTLLAQAYDGIGHALCILNPQAGVIFSNSTFESFFSAELETLHKPGRLLTLFHKRPTAKQLLQHLKNGKDWQGEAVVETTSQALQSTHVSLQCLYDTDGLCVGGAVHFRHLLDEPSTTRTFPDNLPTGLFRIALTQPVSTNRPLAQQVDHIQKHGYLAMCNTAFAQQIGNTSAEALVHTPLAELLPNTLGRLLKAFIRSNYQLQNHRLQQVDPNDQIYHFEATLTGSPRNKQLSSMWGSVCDITQRIELEEQLISALEHQKQQIGRELHDGVGQLLTGLRILSERLSDTLSSSDQTNQELVNKIADFAQNAVEEVYRLERGYTPVDLLKEGLPTALTKLSQTTSSLPGIECTHTTSGSISLPDHTQQVHLYRIAQEAVNNSLRHADPDCIKTYLLNNGTEVVLSIQDDGIGFKPKNMRNQGVGLKSMRYRADLLGAKLTFDSTPDRGTTIHCSLPATSNQ